MSEEQSFAELLEQSIDGPSYFEPGQKVEAEVVSIGREWVFINLGGKSEGSVAVREVTDDEGGVTVVAGDTVVAYFLGTQKGVMLFTTKLGKGSANAHLEEAFHGGIPVEGTVTKEVNGGFEIKLPGSVRGFCPFSQIGMARAENEEAIGCELSFKIIEYRERGKNVIVSHRKIKEEERERLLEEMKDTLQEGMTVSGTITSIKDFGAFVDTGALEGLLPISEICWGRIDDINERLTVGQKVDVVIMKLDWDKNRFSFSLKNALPDPWERVPVDFPEGSTQQGKIVKLAQFGVFVSLAEGIDGLVHISKLGAGRRINHPREVVDLGQEVEVKVESISLEEKRMSLVLVAGQIAGVDGEAAIDPDNKQGFKDYSRKEKSSKGESLGTLGDLLAAKLAKK